jgi:hypothetical protein
MVRIDGSQRRYRDRGATVSEEHQYRIVKTQEAVVSGESDGDALNRFIESLANGVDLGPKATYPLYSVSPVEEPEPTSGKATVSKPTQCVKCGTWIWTSEGRDANNTVHDCSNWNVSSPTPPGTVESEWGTCDKSDYPPHLRMKSCINFVPERRTTE